MAEGRSEELASLPISTVCMFCHRSAKNTGCASAVVVFARLEKEGLIFGCRRENKACLQYGDGGHGAATKEAPGMGVPGA